MNSPQTSKNKSKIREKRPKLTQAGTGKAHRSKSPKSSIKWNQKLLFAAVLVAGVVCAVVGIIKTTASLTEKEQACQQLRNSEDGKEASSPFMVNVCSAKECGFDVTLCSEDCPFAYESDEDNCVVSCACAEHGVIESDISYNQQSLGPMLDAFAYSADPSAKFSVFADGETPIGYWPKNEKGRVLVHYAFIKVDAFMFKPMWETTRFLSKNTCIDLVYLEDTSDIFHISISHGVGCMSLVGWFGRDAVAGARFQNMDLGTSCWKFEVIVHEFMHALGVYHEMSRPDRDQHITVILDNIRERYHKQYRKRTKMTELDKKYSFDISSIMMYASGFFARYGKVAFTLANGDPAPYFTAGNLSEIDLNEINDLYDCEIIDKPDSPSSWSEWMPWTECPRTCGGEVVSRYRRCQYEGSGEVSAMCEGDAGEQMACATADCGGELTEWGPWGRCSTSCGTDGGRQRYRECTVEGGCIQSFFAYQERSKCNIIDCEEAEKTVRVFTWTAWSEWSNMGVCATSTCLERIERTRRCLDNLQQLGSKDDCVYDKEKYSFSADRMKLFHTKKCCHINKGATTTTTTTMPTTTQSTTTTTTQPTTTTQSTTTTTQSTTTTQATTQPTAATQATATQISTTTTPSTTTQPSTTTEATTEGEVYESVLGELQMSRELICLYGKLFVGKFNNDGRDDLLCAYPDGWVRLYYASEDGVYDELSWEGPTQFCKFVHNEGMEVRFVEDLNADGFSDLLCFDARSGNIEITLCKNGMFGNHIDWRGRRELCSNENILLQVKDIDGDMKADILCSKPNIGIQTMSINTKRV